MDHDHLDAMAWRKSSYSGSNGGNCIEVAATARAVAVRDSKNPGGRGTRRYRRHVDGIYQPAQVERLNRPDRVLPEERAAGKPDLTHDHGLRRDSSR